MLEAFHNGKFEYKRLSPEEQKRRGILGRLVGIMADTAEPTRNGRRYSKKLWQNVFNDKIMQEKIENRCVLMELGHPTDRSEIDIEKACACLAEQPKIGDDGKIYGVIDILDTKNGRILKTLCDYGTTVGISSRGEGDLITGFDGQEEVDPDTYTCETWDIVLVPSVKTARLKSVTEALDKTRYNKTLRQSLQESLKNATTDDRVVMEESLNCLGINVNEGAENSMSIVDEFTDEKYNDNVNNVDSDETTTSDDDTVEEHIDDITDESLDIKEDISGKADRDDIFSKIDEASKKFGVELNKDTRIAIMFAIEHAINDSDNISVDADEMAEAYVLQQLLPNIDEFNIEGIDITDESLDIKEDPNCAVDNNEVIVEELQKTVKANATLEQKVLELQEALSACYARETKLNEDAEKYKNSIKGLADKAKESYAFKSKVESLENKLAEQLNTESELRDQLNEAASKASMSKEKVGALRENLTNKSNKVSELTESLKKLKDINSKYKDSYNTLRESYNKAVDKYGKLKESSDKASQESCKKISELNESIEKLKKESGLIESKYKQREMKSKELIEKYKKATSSAINRYISLQAVRIGSTSEEIKNRLPESYSFNDIDKVCESLQEYQLNLSKLPFKTAKTKMNEALKVKCEPSKNEYILPHVRESFDDDIDGDLLYLAGRK